MPTPHEQIRALTNVALASDTMNLPMFLLRSQPGAVVIDIGANKGDMVSFWLDHLASKVIAFEPVPSINAQLTERFKNDNRVWVSPHGISDHSEGLTGVTLLNAFTLGKPGQYDLPVSLENPPPFDVELVPLDWWKKTFLPDTKIDFIKLDVDGYEFHALRGMQKIMAEDRPPIMVELSYLPHKLGESIEAGINWLYAQGYVICTMDGRQCYDARLVLEAYPWHTSFDVMAMPKERVEGMRIVS